MNVYMHLSTQSGGNGATPIASLLQFAVAYVYHGSLCTCTCSQARPAFLSTVHVVGGRKPYAIGFSSMLNIKHQIRISV